MAITKKQLEVHVAKIQRHDGPILLPDGMSDEDAIAVLTRKKEYDKEKVVLSETMPVFVWDGAIALEKALNEMFGIAMQKSTHHPWFGEQPPAQVSVDIGPNETVKVPWGRFSIPGVEGWVSTGYDHDDDGRIVFKVTCETTHKFEGTIKALFDLTRKIATEKSIYEGKAISIRFKDEEGESMGIPSIKFPEIVDNPVIFSQDIMDSIETNILAPIRYTKVCREWGVPLKRGALLAGPYGTGKTLTATLVARVAVENGWTFLYVPKVDELAEALKFAQRYMPIVVFAEDVERIAQEKRTDKVNDLLNTLDGIGSKTDEIITILTSNHAEQINKAMRRPGRIDLVLHVLPPDAQAAVSLVRLYAKGMVRDDEDLHGVGELLKGQIPAVIREVVERSKLESIRRTKGEPTDVISEDLCASAKVALVERELFMPKEAKPDVITAFGQSTHEIIKQAIKAAEPTEVH